MKSIPQPCTSIAQKYESYGISVGPDLLRLVSQLGFGLS